MCHTALLMLQRAQKEMWRRRLPNTNPECLEMRSTWDLKPRLLWRNTASAQIRYKQIHTECNMPILTHVLEFDYIWVVIRWVIWSLKKIYAIFAHFYEPENLSNDSINKSLEQYNQSMQNSLKQSSNTFTFLKYLVVFWDLNWHLRTNWYGRRF